MTELSGDSSRNDSVSSDIRRSSSAAAIATISSTDHEMAERGRAIVREYQSLKNEK